MNRFKMATSVFFVLVVLGPVGCNMSKVRYDNTVKLDPANPSRTMTVEAPKQDQTVAIEISSGETIDIDVALSSDKGKGKPLVHKSDAKSYSGNVKIPAGEAFSITLTLRGNATEVKVKANSVD